MNTTISETLSLSEEISNPLSSPKQNLGSSPKNTSPNPIVIKIYSTHFDPPAVTCNKESTIRWIVAPVKEDNSNSLYFGGTKGHVIGFDQLGLESPYLDTNKMFELTFHQPGIYNYKCLIFGNIEGTIEVLSDEEGAITTDDINKLCKNKGASKSICSVGASTDIERGPGEEKLPMILEETENIKKVIEKYLKKSKWELPVELALELDKIEKEIPFFEEDSKEIIDQDEIQEISENNKKKKPSRNKIRRQRIKRRHFLEKYQEECKLIRHILGIEFFRIWYDRVRILSEYKEKDKMVEIENKAKIIFKCMQFEPSLS